MTRLVLGSTSPGRAAILTGAHIGFVARGSDVDEDAVLADARARFGGLTPSDVALLLARTKAEAVADDLSDADSELTALATDSIVLGGDSVLELDGEVLGKPHVPEVAVERWRRQRGRTATLHSGLWLVDLRRDGAGATLGAVASTDVTFAEVTDAEIEAYVATGEPLEVAGAFTIDGRGGAFVEHIDGDPSTVVGLSLPLLRRLLEQIDVDVTDLWTPR